MASAAGLALAAGGITMANEVIFAPAAGGKAPEFNWRIIPATVLLAFFMTGLESISPKLAEGLGWTMLVTVFVAPPVGNARSPIDNINRSLGLQK